MKCGLQAIRQLTGMSSEGVVANLCAVTCKIPTMWKLIETFTCNASHPANSARMHWSFVYTRMLANRDWQRGCRSDLTEAIKSDTVRTWESKVDVVSNEERRQVVDLAPLTWLRGHATSVVCRTQSASYFRPTLGSKCPECFNKRTVSRRSRSVRVVPCTKSLRDRLRALP